MDEALIIKSAEAGQLPDNCPYCMHPLREDGSCPVCGRDSGSYVPSPHHLPPGTLLHDRYLVGGVLGEGGFGITYIGRDLLLELPVAVKEYFPVEKAVRYAAEGPAINSVHIAGQEKSFREGRDKFLEEARAMASLDRHLAIAGAKDFFEENNTAYIVMEYIRGITFAELAGVRGVRIPPEDLFRLVRPLFPALGALHEKGMVHRDISPDNLMLEMGESQKGDCAASSISSEILRNGRVRLLDFGCARESGAGENTLTITLKHGYAPIEQYHQKGQGPWTDVYALCATLCFCLTGVRPPSALERIAADPLRLPGELGVEISPARENALRKGLRMQPRRRFQTIRELEDALYGEERNSLPVMAASASGSGRIGEKPPHEKKEKSIRKRIQKWIPAIVLPALLCALLVRAFFPSLTGPVSSEQNSLSVQNSTSPAETAGNNFPQTHDVSILETNDAAVPAAEDDGLSEMAEEAMPEMPEEDLPEMPEKEIPEMPEEGLPEIPEEELPEMPEEDLPGIHKTESGGDAAVSKEKLSGDTEDTEPSDRPADHLPSFVGQESRIYENDYRHYKAAVIVGSEKEKDYQAYVDLCREMGYTVDAWSESEVYSNGVTGRYCAWNDAGYYLVIDYNGSFYTIDLSAPLDLSALQWPGSDLRGLLPKPASSEGMLVKNTPDELELYVGETTEEQYGDYVEQCMKAGFRLEYDRLDKSFSAQNTDGYRLQIKYVGFGVMWISLDGFLAE